MVFVSVLNICLKMCVIGTARTDWDRLTEVVKSSQSLFRTVWEICFDQLYLYRRCTCGNCQRLQRVEECICYPEIDCIVARNNEAVEHEEPKEPLVCVVTQNPGFNAVCLNRWVLQIAWYLYKQQCHNSYEGPKHKQNRHVAYKQLARWCWGILGREVRLALSFDLVRFAVFEHTSQALKKTFLLKDFALFCCLST